MESAQSEENLDSKAGGSNPALGVLSSSSRAYSSDDLRSMGAPMSGPSGVCHCVVTQLTMKSLPPLQMHYVVTKQQRSAVLLLQAMQLFCEIVNCWQRRKSTSDTGVLCCDSVCLACESSPSVLAGMPLMKGHSLDTVRESEVAGSDYDETETSDGEFSLDRAYTEDLSEFPDWQIGPSQDCCDTSANIMETLNPLNSSANSQSIGHGLDFIAP